jgi:hypothetical protein
MESRRRRDPASDPEQRRAAVDTDGVESGPSELAQPEAAPAPEVDDEAAADSRRPQGGSETRRGLAGEVAETSVLDVRQVLTVHRGPAGERAPASTGASGGLGARPGPHRRSSPAGRVNRSHPSRALTLRVAQLDSTSAKTSAT